MNDDIIERVLLQAPQPEPPPALLPLLESQIVLPRPENRHVNGLRAWRPGFSPRRWIPALAFGLFLLSCVILVGVQTVWIQQLNREHEELRAAGASLAQLRERHAQSAAVQALNAELENARRDLDEARRLRTELEQLRALPDAIARLHEENHQLKAALATIGAADELFFEDAQKEEEKWICVDNLKQLGLAIRIFANDHGDRSPTSFTIMSNEVGQVKYLVCPGDKSRQAYASATVAPVEIKDHMTSRTHFAKDKFRR